MGFRGKLALVFAWLLILAVTAISALEFERTTRMMVSNLNDTGVSLTNQIFEQMRVALGQPGDPLATLRNDPAISSSLRSAQAFTKGVVYARVEAIDGSVIAGTPLPSPVDSIEIRWPSGQVDTWKSLPANRLYVVAEGGKLVKAETLANWKK